MLDFGWVCGEMEHVLVLHVGNDCCEQGLCEMREIGTCSPLDVGEDVLRGKKCCAFKFVTRFWVYV
jgi:hypothetical protein